MVNNHKDTCDLHRFKDIREMCPLWASALLLAPGCPAGQAGRWVRTALSPAPQVVRYEAGYVVCAVIAGLYLLAVPTAGLCFCCCRGHQRCGGPGKTEYKEMACERGTLMTFLLLTTLVLL